MSKRKNSRLILVPSICLFTMMSAFMAVNADEIDNPEDIACDSTETQACLDNEENIDPESTDINTEGDAAPWIITDGNLDVVPDIVPEVVPEINTEDFIILESISFSSPCLEVIESNSGVYRNEFTGVDLATYQILKQSCTEVALGQRQSTVFDITVSELGYKDVTYTAQDFGYEYFYDYKTGTYDYDAVKYVSNYIFSQLTGDFDSIYKTLIYDCPFELYWFNKTATTRCNTDGDYIAFAYNTTTHDFDVVLKPEACIHYYFPVASGYSADTYMVSEEAISNALVAANTAQNIVETYSDLSDLDKLTKYKDEICSRVSYNNAAAGTGSSSFGDPWQLIYVFDDDSSTNVVCEGYSKAFKYLCDLSDFKTDEFSCIMATGYFVSSNGTSGSHMWNIVSFGNGMNYLVDVTNSDNGNIGYPDVLFIRNTDGQLASDKYKFMCKGVTITYQYDSQTQTIFRDDVLAVSSEAIVDAPVIILSLSSYSVDLSWDSVEDAAKYDVLRRKEGGEWELLTETTKTTYSDYDVISGTGYSYAIRALRSDGTYMNIIEEEYSIVYVYTNPSGVCGDNITWEIDESGTLWLNGSGDMYNYDSNTFPWKSVKNTIRSIQIEDGITSIGDYAFYVSRNLNSVSIPDSVTSIGSFAFVDCRQLTSVTIPENVTYIGRQAFSYCTGLTEVVIPRSVQTVEYGAFMSCSGLESVVIDENAYNSDAFLGIDSSKIHYYYHILYISLGYGSLSGTEYAYYGQEIPVTVTPDAGYNIDSVFVNDGIAPVDLYPNASGTYSFTMPDGLVEVYATFYPDLTIKSQPVNFTGAEGNTATFTVVAEGKDLSYQWQVYKNGDWKNTTLDGNKTATLSVGIMEARDGMTFRCIITDSLGNEIATDRATLLVAEKPVITSQPVDVTGVTGKTATFTVLADGNDITYQWQINKDGAWKNTSLDGNKTSTLSVGVTESRNGMTFRCVVKNLYGATTVSDEATLYVANPAEIKTQPSDFLGAAGETAEFTVNADGEGLTYQWQVFKNGTWKNTSLDGNKTSTLSVGITDARNEMKFRCVITNGIGAVVISDEATLFVGVRPEILNQPSDYIGITGKTAKFSVTAEGEGLTYQWQVYKNGVWKKTYVPGNMTSKISVDITEARDGMKFRCVVTNADGLSSVSDEASIVIGQKPEITVQPADYSGSIGDTAVFKIEAEGENLTYQWQVYKNGAWKNTSIAGNQSSELPVAVTESRNGMTFRCVVTNGEGFSVVSDEVKVLVVQLYFVRGPFRMERVL